MQEKESLEQGRRLSAEHPARPGAAGSPLWVLGDCSQCSASLETSNLETSTSISNDADGESSRMLLLVWRYGFLSLKLVLFCV